MSHRRHATSRAEKIGSWRLPAALALGSFAWVLRAGIEDDHADPTISALGGWLITRGLYPYVDYGIPVGPVAFLIQAIGMACGGGIFGIALPAALTSACVTGLFTGLGQRNGWSRLSLVGAGIFLAISVFGWRGRVWYNDLAALFGLGPLVIAALAPAWLQARPLGFSLAAGFSLGLSVLSKQDMGLLSVVMVPVLLAAAPGLAWRSRAAIPAACGVGALAAMALVLSPVLLQGEWSSFRYWFNLGQPPHDTRRSSWLDPNLARYTLKAWRRGEEFREVIAGFVGAAVAGALALLEWYRRAPRARGRRWIPAARELAALRGLAYPIACVAAVYLAAAIVNQTSGGDKLAQPATGLLAVLGFELARRAGRARAVATAFLVAIALWYAWSLSPRLRMGSPAFSAVLSHGLTRGARAHPETEAFRARYQVVLDEVARASPDGRIRAWLHNDPILWDERILPPKKGRPLWFHNPIILFPREIAAFVEDFRAPEYDLVAAYEEKLYSWYSGPEFTRALFDLLRRNYTTVLEFAPRYADVPEPREKIQVHVHNRLARQVAAALERNR